MDENRAFKLYTEAKIMAVVVGKRIGHTIATEADAERERVIFALEHDGLNTTLIFAMVKFDSFESIDREARIAWLEEGARDGLAYLEGKK
jgi:hypothetical protein